MRCLKLLSTGMKGMKSNSCETIGMKLPTKRTNEQREMLSSPETKKKQIFGFKKFGYKTSNQFFVLEWI